mmetsp:Transcript_43597/g.79708  ORF Transcript_43597/g.79708 Transcript_43597/m.79708 type:complete len:551 (-) Transcript_43597:69-1721(-)
MAGKAEEDGKISKSGAKSKQQVKIAMVNLIDKHGDQGRLGVAFDSVLAAVLEVYDGSSSTSSSSSATTRKNQKKIVGKQPKEAQHQHEQHPSPLGPGSIEHIWYDFHAECKGGRWDRLALLLEQCTPILNEQGYFCAVPNDTGSWAIQKVQDGVVRTNCMDCLDRTNVVQSMFGRYMLHRQLHERPGLSFSSSTTNTPTKRRQRTKRQRTLPLECVVGYKQRPLTLPWTEGEAAHRYLWADNADAISRLYAGTPALKGDFTRTGKRTKRGALDDGLNSLQRYYLNNFIDADRQEGMDLLVGSVEFHMMPSDEYDDDSIDDETSRVFMLQELAKSSNRRSGYDETHARIKVKAGQPLSFGGSGVEEERIRNRKLTLKWLPGDLRHHMRSEALRSRSPLSPAAEEENIEGAKKSSDFLLQVTSSAAGDYDEVPPTLGVGALEALHSIDHRASSVKPWWVVSSVKEELDESSSGQQYDMDGVGYHLSETSLKGGNSLQLHARNVLGFARKGVAVAATSLILLAKAPILSAALIVAVVACGFPQSLDRADWDSD